MKMVSVVFHPLLIATYLSALILYQSPELFPRIQPQVAPQFILVVFLLTAALPGFSIFLLRSFKYISDMELMKRNERLVPFTFILFYYAAACYLFIEKLEMGVLFSIVMISVTVLIFILLIITAKFKISIHSAAVWGSVGYLTGIHLVEGIPTNLVFYFLLIAAGLTSTSRLYLGYHRPTEVWSGAIFGFSYSFIVVLFYF